VRDALSFLVEEDLIDEDVAKFLYLRHKCKRDLYWLGTKVLGYKGDRVDPSFHQWFCKELDVEQDTLFLLPRDHTKSTWGIAIKVTQDVLRDPNISILLASLTSSLSIKRLDVIKKQLEDPTLTTLFPDFLSPNPSLDVKSQTSFFRNVNWKQNEITVIRDLRRAEATIETTGVEQTITGRHYERIYLDDIIDYQTVVSEVKTESALQFFKYIVPMIEPIRGVLRIYGTRYDPADLYGWLIDKVSGEEVDFPIDMRIINREVKETFETFKQYQPIMKSEFNKRKVYDKESGEEKTFIYQYYNDELLAKKRNIMESDFIFFCQFFNRIEGVDEKVFPPPYRETDALPEGLDYYLTVDPAFKVSKRSDFTALVVCGYNKSDAIYIAEAIRLKGDPTLLLNTMYELYDRYEFKVGGIESGAWGESLEWNLEYARKELGREKLPIIPLKLKFEAGAKDTRIRGLSVYFKSGSIVLRSGLDDLKREMLRYPGNSRSKDDLLDALSMQRELISWKRNEVREEREYVRQRQTWREAMGVSRERKAVAF
jgi:predicted phage terminase large subunit-like protein